MKQSMKIAVVVLVVVVFLFMVARLGTRQILESNVSTGAAPDIQVIRLELARAEADESIEQVLESIGDTSASAPAQLNERIRVASEKDSAYRSELAHSNPNALAKPSMMEAPPAPLVQGFADGSNWMLQGSLLYKIGHDTPFAIVVPRGFVTDFASVPKRLHSVIGPTGPYSNSAVVHDYLYWIQSCTRKQSDNILAIGMREAGVDRTTATAIHVAVKRFGDGAWKSNKAARDSGQIRTVAPPDDHVPATSTWEKYRKWLRENAAKAGEEFPVDSAVCKLGNTDSIPNSAR